MGNIKVIIVGVSDYSASGRENLPFCKNDIFAVNRSLIKGLNVDQTDIILCGETGHVAFADFISALNQLIHSINENDTVIIYYSGHGKSDGNEHYLIFNDTLVKTQQIIDYLDRIKAKSKILLLDCCFAGNFTVDDTAVFDINETADQFASKGYAVIASCNAHQYSSRHPDKQISLFTNFLCEAITHPLIIRKGKKSLFDIWKLLFMFLENWNKIHPEDAQNPIYRASIGGTIFFDIEDYHPYFVREHYEDCDSYIIYSVKPCHNPSTKRFSVQVILKQPMSYSEMARINHQIVKKVKWLDIYQTAKQERKWSNKPANIVFCYFGLDETDMVNTNYICRTVWVDNSQDKKWWYRSEKNSEIIDNIHFNFHSYYHSLKIFNAEHTTSREQIITETRSIITRMVSLAEQLISHYNELINGSMGEADFKNHIELISAEIHTLYIKETDLDIPPIDIKEWSNLCSTLAGIIHDLTLYYGNNCFSTRSPENRKACMELSIKRYYETLDRFKSLDTLE